MSITARTLARAPRLSLALLVLATTLAFTSACKSDKGPQKTAGTPSPELAQSAQKTDIWQQYLADLDKCSPELRPCQAFDQMKSVAKAAKDDAERQTIQDTLLKCMETGSTQQRYACAMTANFSLAWPKALDNAQAPTLLLKAIDEEIKKQAAPNMAAVRMAEYLSKWHESPKGQVAHPQILALLTNSAVPWNVRAELLRLATMSLKRPEVAEAAMVIVQSDAEPPELRKQVLRIGQRMPLASREKLAIWATEQITQNTALATQALDAIGNYGTSEQFEAILKEWPKHREDKTWASSMGRAMMDFARRRDIEVDSKKVYDTALGIVDAKELEPFFKTNAVYALRYADSKRAQKDLERLAKGENPDLARAAQRQIDELARQAAIAETARQAAQKAANPEAQAKPEEAPAQPKAEKAPAAAKPQAEKAPAQDAAKAR